MKCIFVSKKSAGLGVSLEDKIANKLSALCVSLDEAVCVLESKVIDAKSISETLDASKFYRAEVFSAMQSLRAVADELETMVASDTWPLPVYSELLFNI